MNKSEFEKYNTPFQRLLRNMFADSIKTNGKRMKKETYLINFSFCLVRRNSTRLKKK